MPPPEVVVPPPPPELSEPPFEQAAPDVGLKSTSRKMPAPPFRVPTFSTETSTQSFVDEWT